MQMDLFSHKTATMQLYRQLLAEALRTHGLTQMEMDVVLFLANNPGHDTARDLVEVRHLSKSHVSTAVDSLVQRNFLQRVHKPGNKKLIHLQLLPAAQAAVASGQEAQAQFFRLLFEGFSKQEATQLGTLLNRVEQNALAACERLEHEGRSHREL